VKPTASKACAKCGRRPAYWHRDTLSFLCTACKERFIRNQKRAGAALDWGLRALAGGCLLAGMLIAAAGLWAMIVVALGVAP
jgi:hypothetical protein